MSQFSLYKNANKATQKLYPYLLDVQSDLLDDLKTAVVIPLMPKRLAEGHIISRLNPAIKIGTQSFVVMTQNIAGIDRAILGSKECDLDQYRAEVTTAIDFVLSGI